MSDFSNMTAKQFVVKGYFTAALVMIFFIIGCSVGIDIHSKCAVAKDSKLYTNLRDTLSYGLTSGITTMAVLTVIRFMGGAEPTMKPVALMYALVGVITSGMTIGMFYKCKDDVSGDRKKALETFAWLSLFMSIIGGGVVLMIN
jgi:magnesium-transporting ATPase (P-type)